MPSAPRSSSPSGAAARTSRATTAALGSGLRSRVRSSKPTAAASGSSPATSGRGSASRCRPDEGAQPAKLPVSPATGRGEVLGMDPTHPDERRLFEVMLLIRAFEPEAERQYKAAKIGGYCHLATGQEATHVGAVGAMRDDDVLIAAYRDHSLALARGVSPKAVMAELFGRVDGCAHGRGGSMHLLDVEHNFFGGWGIVGGHLPIATGIALEIVRRDEPRAVLCELGDGAVNTGAWHESLNLAGLWDLPIVFYVVNNVYGMGTHVERASAEPELHKRASAFRIHGGHSVADAGWTYRSKEEVAEHQRHDPLDHAARRLIELGVLEEGELDGL